MTFRNLMTIGALALFAATALSAQNKAAWKMPRTAEVTVSVPGLRTPRIDMQRCSASIITNAPRGASAWTIASAIWVVNRSCTCGRLAKPSTNRANFDKPVMRPSSPGMYATCARPWNGMR